MTSAVQGGKRHPAPVPDATCVTENPTLQPQEWADRPCARCSWSEVLTETSHGCQQAKPLPCSCVGSEGLQGWWDTLRTRNQTSQHTRELSPGAGAVSHPWEPSMALSCGWAAPPFPSELVFCPPESPKDNVRQGRYIITTSPPCRPPDSLLNTLEAQCDHRLAQE